MRLTCPNCSAEYEISYGMVPSAGRHVQCTACHTRWFVRGVPGTGLTEDQILRRLETWSPGPRPMPAPVAATTPAASDASAEPERQPNPDVADPPVIVHLPPRQAAPAKPADRPAVAQPAPLSAPARPPQPATRLDLGEPTRPVAATPPPPGSRFAQGLLLAFAVAAFALAAYHWRAPIAARVPEARPALTAYGETVDRWRAELEERIARFRQVEPPSSG